MVEEKEETYKIVVVGASFVGKTNLIGVYGKIGYANDYLPTVSEVIDIQV